MTRLKPDPEAIRRHRVAQRLSVAELARRGGFHREHLSAIEHGRLTPRDYTLGRIADALGVDLDELLVKEAS